MQSFFPAVTSAASVQTETGKPGEGLRLPPVSDGETHFQLKSFELKAWTKKVADHKVAALPVWFR